ncbi:hypothetical protein SAMN04487846_0568 [Microbacterium sp. cf046]|uniref:hypothetical protein n=1 Tax=Microbacterium sp. cf046 TaxID=1761803 RepID=UPI0008E88545|nr:hypothetical protein [Microbacterium sp. cf046]SFR91680.1 hypothetical protein SAMN04487846_0568 [Microbacterium sp. cf046]
MALATAPDGFVTVELLTEWQQNLDRRGLRATGSAAHADYIDDLARRLTEAGVDRVWTEAVPMRRWTPEGWSLRADGDDIQVISPVPYSGSTASDGVTGPLSSDPGEGVIGVVRVTLPPYNAGMFDMLDWGAPALPVHPVDYSAADPYERIWLSQDEMRAQLARFVAGGAAGLIISVDLPADELTDAYLLYDGVHRGLPALFVGREEGDALLSRVGAAATLTLEASIKEVETHNILGFIPGASDELVVIQSHTDGPNGLEDNGPEAIIAMAAHLAGIPTGELDRGILILLTTGHFAIEEAWGVEAFLATHRDDLVPRIAAALCLEHLGARVAPEGWSGHRDDQEYEFGCCFTTHHEPVIAAMRKALDAAHVTESRVVRPFVPDLTGRSPDGLTWPGDGCPFWHAAGLPAANFITGPGYLLNAEPVAHLIDIEAMRRQLIAFTAAARELSAVPWDRLRGSDRVPASIRAGR